MRRTGKGKKSREEVKRGKCEIIGSGFRKSEHVDSIGVRYLFLSLFHKLYMNICTNINTYTHVYDRNNNPESR